MDDIWEPWAPKIGQRVRVRLNPECTVHTGRADIARLNHNGLIGEVTADLRDRAKYALTGPSPEYRERAQREEATGHWWRVDFGRLIGVRVDGHQIHADLLAASELEPVP